MKATKKIIALCLTVFCLMSCVACGGQTSTSSSASTSTSTSTSSGKNEVALITINTSTVGGGWYPMGTAMANTLSNHIPNMKASAAPSGGTVENVNAIMDGSADIAMVMCDIPYAIYHGTSEEFEQYQGFRTLYMFTDNLILLVAKKSAGIDSVQDLIGKKVGMSVAGSNAYNLACDIMEAHGIDPQKDIEIYQGSQNQQVQAIKDGNIDAYIMTHPSGGAGSGLLELDATEDMEVINFDPAALEIVSKSFPVYVVGEAPAGYISCMKENTPTIIIPCAFIVDESMDEELVYEITKATFEYKKELDGVASAWEDTNENTAAVNCPFPLHPGAEKYFKEVGWEISILP